MVAWNNSRSVANKIIKIFSDNTVLPSEWKYGVPIMLVQQPKPLVINLKNFADGIQQNIELYGIDIPMDKIAQDPYSHDYLID